MFNMFVPTQETVIEELPLEESPAVVTEDTQNHKRILFARINFTGGTAYGFLIQNKTMNDVERYKVQISKHLTFNDKDFKVTVTKENVSGLKEEYDICYDILKRKKDPNGDSMITLKAHLGDQTFDMNLPLKKGSRIHDRWEDCSIHVLEQLIGCPISFKNIFMNVGHGY